MQEKTIILELETTKPQDVAYLANNLVHNLLISCPNIKVKQARLESSAQDFGSSLIIALSAPAIVALAKGLANWLSIQSSEEITIKVKNNDHEMEIIAKNIGSRHSVEDILKILEKGFKDSSID